MISADNLSFFALSAVPYPGAFTLHTDAGKPDTDDKFKLWWDASSDTDSYSIYKSSSPITTLTGTETLVKSGITGLEEPITETANVHTTMWLLLLMKQVRFSQIASKLKLKFPQNLNQNQNQSPNLNQNQSPNHLMR